MRIDLIIESDKSATDFSRLGHLAEDYGLGCVWVPNNANGRDAFVNFVPLAMRSGRIMMGPMAISSFELHPLKMGLALLSLNEIAGGRAAITIGGGGGVAENIEMIVRVVGAPLQRHTVSRLPQQGQGAASGLDNIGAEIERFKEFERQGLRQISLKVYGNPEQAIRVIGEHMVPALSSG